MKFHILDAARKQLRGAVAYYNRIRLELGSKFKSAVNAAFDQVEMWPQGCAKVSGDVRICRIKGFRYGLVYVHRETEIVVVAVMHLHRRPGYWKRRLKEIDP
jgi:toxin ParE2